MGEQSAGGSGVAAPAARARVQAQRLVRGVRARRLARPTADGPVQVLHPANALRENGFAVFRGLFPPAECTELAAAFAREGGIVEGEEFTRVDSVNRFQTSRRVLFDGRLLSAVRAALAPEVRFLQVSDLHYLHDTAGWHRDSVHRAADSSDAPDWSDGQFGIVKAILYLESDNAAMGVMAGSHLSPRAVDRDLVKAVERRGGQVVLDAGDEPNRRFTPQQKRRPVVWRAQVGDVLIFDQRMYHAGRRVVDGQVSKQDEATKFTLSMVFGLDNQHSTRFHSYFRYARRELFFKDFDAELQARLADHDLLLSSGLGNYYLQHPQELRLAHLRNPEDMDDLIARFTRQAAGPRPAGPAS